MHTQPCLRLALSCWALLCGIRAQQQAAEQCGTEPWGRYSASGGKYQNYLYSIGGDTSSVADQRGGGVIRTNFRFDLMTGCWQRITDSPEAVGYRATATLLNGSFYVFGGGDMNYRAVDNLWKLSLPDHTWTEVTNATTSARPSARYKHAAVKLSETTMLIHGGRQGNVVLSDAWIFDIRAMKWTSLGDTNVTAYRHGMAFDTKRALVWTYGGIDDSFSRKSVMHSFDLASFTMSTSVPNRGSTPGLRASHAIEYLAEMDSLLLYGGTCGEEADLFLYNISDNSWCSLDPARRPSRRDAMLWAFDFPNFYMYTGDVICVAIGDVYSIADVHALNISDPQAWNLIYNPINQRSPDLVDDCDGTNARMCRAPPLFPDQMAGETIRDTCSSSTPTSIASPAPTVVSNSPSSILSSGVASADFDVPILLLLGCGALALVF